MRFNIRREILERDDDGVFSPENLPEDKYLRKAPTKARRKSTRDLDDDAEGIVGFHEL
ncbi:hypothetical protein KQI84_18705 [bacterium]|nr:hypothetical protein [bacterium]